MPRDPGSTWRPLSEDKRQPNHKKTLVIVHSAAGKGSLFNFFENRSDLESTFWVSLGGDREQYLDSLRRADANKSANGLAISIENEDHGDPDNEPMPDAQVQANIDIINWAIEEEAHDIARCLATSPSGTGVGYHTMWGAPSSWTPVAKTCPGRRRIEQFYSDILPEITKGVVKEEDEDEMKTWLIRSPNGAVFVFNGLYLIPANDGTYRAILKWHGTDGDPWHNWSQEQIDSVPKLTGLIGVK